MRIADPQGLWIGNAASARSPVHLFHNNIEAVVDVAIEEAAAELPRELIYCRIPLLDGTGNSAGRIRLVISTVVELLNDNVPTLLSCSAGMSRSPLIAAAVVARIRQLSFDDAIRRITNDGHHDLSAALYRDVAALAKS